MLPIRPPRSIAYFALLAIALAAATIAIRAAFGDSTFALVLGPIAVLLGLVVVIALLRERTRATRIAEPRYPDIYGARKVGIVGAALVVGSFAFLGIEIYFLGAGREHIMLFRVWLAIFLVGFVCLFYPVVLRWAISIGLTPRKKDD